LLINKTKDNTQKKNIPPARVKLIEANREKKRNGKGSNSPGSDNPRAKKIQHNIDKSCDLGKQWRVDKIINPWKSKKKLRKRKEKIRCNDGPVEMTDTEQSLRPDS
jgi:hypothetical protein